MGANRTLTLTRRSRIETAADDLYDWHFRPGAFERLVAPWSRVEILERPESITEGSRFVFKVKTGPIWRKWVAEHRQLEPGRQFTDVQVSGPFRRWWHTHRFLPDGPNASFLEDHVDYELPFGAGLVASPIRSQIERMFAYRHAVTIDDIRNHARFASVPRKTVAISGASGLVGRTLTAFLTTGGHVVRPLVRTRPRSAVEIFWNPITGDVEREKLEGVDAVIHLAGENIAGGRWTAERKARIRDSRVDGTRRLAEALATLDRRPSAFLTASAVGFYGARGDEPLDEAAAPGTGFLPDVCRAWESATAPASSSGIRTATLRLGIVLSPRGGALAKMLTPFRLGLGGPLGDGRQYMSWIGLDDVIGAIHHVLMTPDLAGPINLTSPEPMTNQSFTETLGAVLRRPAVFRVSAGAARKLFGDMADPLLLTGCRAIPQALGRSEYRFRHSTLETCLRYLLGKPPAIRVADAAWS